jgi:hypothetical protein
MQGPFLYFGAEDDDDEIHIRLDQMRIKLGLSWDDLADFHFCSFVGEEALVAILDEGVLQHTPLLDGIETRIRDLGAIACVSRHIGKRIRRRRNQSDSSSQVRDNAPGRLHPHPIINHLAITPVHRGDAERHWHERLDDME